MNWKFEKLGDVCEVIAGQSPPSASYNNEAIGLPFFQGKADFGEHYPNVRLWCKAPNKIAEANDVLLSVRAPVGPTNICNLKSCIGRGLAAIRSNGKTHHKYIYYYFKYIEEKLSNTGNGSTFSAITIGNVKDILIPLPDVPTQQKIASILDKADELRRKDQQLLAKYDELLQSIFYDMFGDPVKNNKSWKTILVKEIGKVVTGNTPSRNISKYYGNELEWIKTDNIIRDNLYPTSAREYLSLEGVKVGRVVSQNSILVTCIAGSETTIGNVSLLNRKVAFNQQINAVIPDVKYHPLYIYFLFYFSKRIIQDNTTKGMKRIITKSVFENLKFIDTPLKLQNRFVELVTPTLYSKQLSIDQIFKSESLFQSLLQKAFKGELVS